MGWIHTGGGYYEDEETGERIRGKRNLPADAVYADAESQPSPSEKELPCMTCHKMTVHTPRSSDSTEWASYTCSECEGKTRVSLK